MPDETQQPINDPFAISTTGSSSPNPNGTGNPSGNYVLDDGSGGVQVTVNNGEEVFNFNLDSVPEGGDFPIPPAGTYVCMVTDFKMDTSKTGNPMVVFTYSLVRHATAPTTPTHNAKVWDYIVLHISRVRDAFSALGIPLNGEVHKSGIIGRQVLLQLKHDMYDGQKRLKVARYAPHPKGAGFRDLDFTGTSFEGN